MKIGFDIVGVLSKYPKQFHELMERLCPKRTRFVYPNDIGPPNESIYREWQQDIYVIAGTLSIEEVKKLLKKNGFDFVLDNNIYRQDYKTYGNLSKAKLISELNIDIFIYSFDDCLQWDLSFGPQPILLQVQPDISRHYWADEWKW